MPIGSYDGDSGYIKGATDDTQIGNVADSLKANVTASALPTGASTSANQNTEITALQLIDNPIGSVNAGAAGTNSFLVGAVFNTAAPALTNTQQVSLQVDASGQLKTAGSITSTVGSYSDKGSFTYGTDKFNPTGGIFQDTNPSLTAGQVGVSRMTANRGLHVNLRDASGAEFATLNNPLIISPTSSSGLFRIGDITTASTSLVAVRRTTYNEQTSDAQRSIVSSSANDSSAGTGARTVIIEYTNFAGVGGFTETVTMNGVTAVNTVATNICYIDRIIVLSVGSTKSNVGIISLKAATGGAGATIGTIAATDNRSFWSHYYIGTGKTFNLTGASVSHSGTTVGSGGLFIMRAVPLNNLTAVEQQISDFIRLYGQSSTFSRVYSSPITVIGPARIVMYVTPETSSSTVYRASMDFYEL